MTFFEAMDQFCGSQFWDTQKTWNTSNPYFTPCFEQTILVWFPCGILWLFAPLDIYWSITSQAKNIPWSALNGTKIIFTAILFLLELIILEPIVFAKGLNYYAPVELYTPVIKAASYFLSLILLMLTKTNGVRSSGVLFVFWFLSAVCEAVRFRTVLTSVIGNGPTQTPGLTPYILEIIYFPCVVALLFLNCWADVGPTYKKDARVVDRPCPEEGASYLSRILYEWYAGLAYQGYKKPLEYSDLWELNEEDKSKTLVPTFNKYWAQELAKASRAAEKKAAVTDPSYSQVNGDIDGKGKAGSSSRKKLEKDYVSIVPALLKSFGSTFIFGSILKVIPDLLVFVSPQILNLLIAFVNQDEEDWKGYLYAVLLFVSAFAQTILMAQYSHRMYMTGLRVRTALVSAVYRKALVVSNAAKRESTVGEIVNLMSVDVQKIMDLIPFVNMLWGAPLQIGVAMYFLWDILGPSVLAGLAVIILLIPANAYFAAKARKYQIIQMKNKDQRVKLINEILSGIKVLKLYAWEPSFEKQIMSIREKEIDVLRLAAYLNAGTNFLWTCAPFLVALATFATYVLSGDNVLDPQKAFVSLSLLNVINLAVTFLPMIIVFTVQAVVSVKRLNKFMNSEEIDPSNVSHDQHETDPIVIESGNFSWEEGVQTLHDINLRVKPGSLVAVVGTVGSGKSSLLSAMLGEMDKLSGRVNTKGSISYVAQQAWIQNATLRDNITFGYKFDPVKYDRVVEACALKPDLEILPGGDKTEIGEKGINLSGGQKQRVSLARATYNNSDVFLFDDPLSAVDSHVGKHIFEKVLGPKGLLKKKTRVLVTHGIAFLPQMDQIIVLKDGEISETGTYQELLDKKGAFADFLSQHITSDDISELELEDGAIIKDLQGAGISLEKARSRRRRNSEGERSEGETPSDYSYRRQLSNSGKEARELRRRVSESPSTGKDVKVDKLIEIEKSETDSVKMTVYLDYFRAAGWTLTIWTSVLYLAFQGFSVGANMWLSVWSNEPVINGTQDASKTGMYLGVYAGLGIFQAITIMAATIAMAFGTLKSAAVLHWKMLTRVFKAPMSFFDTTPVGRIVNRFAKDIDICDNTIPFMLRLWLNSFLQVASTLVIISYSTPIFIVVIIPIGAIYYFVQRFYVSTSRQLKRLESVTRSPIYSHFSESITGSSTIRAYGQQERFILESENKVDYNQKSYFPAVTANRWLAVRLETVGNTVIFFAAMFAVLGRETLNPGLVGLSVSYALQITIALNMLVRWTSDVETNIVAVERIKEYTETPQEADWEIPGRKPPPSWPESGEVTFDHYKTRYRDGLELVLRNVTCKISGGEKIGIVGRTGAGKSSLTLGLFRIIEAAGGSITIDGQNIAKLGLHDVRGRITIIPQDPVLFSGTLRINLDPFERQTDDEIWRALELSHLKTFVKGLASGLQHEIAEGGDNLSVGQRQLVCLARALLRKTKILILDEATAAVDLETDDLIQETIRKEFHDSTVITIAHRLNTIMDSTRVIVLDKGEISEFDTPSNLMSNKQSIFYGMAKDAGLC